MGNALRKYKKSKKHDSDIRRIATPVDFELILAKYNWTQLVFQGGGAKVIASIGALRVLEIVGALKNVTKFAGTSAGSIVALCLCLGYTADELFALLMKTDFGQLVETCGALSGGLIGDAVNIVRNYGISDGNSVVEFVAQLLADRGYARELTFAELRERTNKELVVVGSNISAGRPEIFTAHTSPNMQVCQAIRISTAIPFVFTPVQDANLDHDLMVDGGLYWNYPLEVFDVDKGGSKSNASGAETLGIRYDSTAQNAQRRDIQNVVQYGNAIVTRLLNEVDHLRIQLAESTQQGFWARTICIHTGGVAATDVALDGHTKCMLYDNGVRATTEFLAKWVKKNWFNRTRNGIRRNSDDAIRQAEKLRLLIYKANTYKPAMRTRSVSMSNVDTKYDGV